MKKSILITGASTGIGNHAALHLCNNGWQVFAGVRNDEAAEKLIRESGGHIVPVTLDVTSAESVRQSRERIEASLGDSRLNALCNNAGVAVGGALECLPLDDIRRQYEINVFGQIAVTQAFLEHLRDTKGRLLFTSSIAGRSAVPFMGPYCSSKFALEALADALRLEVRRWGIQVSLIEPGAIRTPIWEKSTDTAQRVYDSLGKRGHELYGDTLNHFFSLVQQSGTNASPVGDVTRAIEHALGSSRPRKRYLVGWDARQRIILEMLPTSLRDWILAKKLGLG